MLLYLQARAFERLLPGLVVFPSQADLRRVPDKGASGVLLHAHHLLDGPSRARGGSLLLLRAHSHPGDGVCGRGCYGRLGGRLTLQHRQCHHLHSVCLYDGECVSSASGSPLVWTAEFQPVI